MPPARTARERLARFLSHPATDIAVIVLILCSIVLLLLELGESERHSRAILELVNEGIMAIFVVELGLRLLAEKKKHRFFREYWVDVLSVLPALRVLRILRVMRLMRVFRFGIAVSRRLGWLNNTLRSEAVQWFAVTTYVLMVVVFAAIGIAHTEEQQSLSDNIWWSVMSLIAGEPIGDVPDSQLGKVITLVVMCSGATMFAMLTGLLSAVMVHRMGAVDLKTIDLDDVRDHIVICGWNRSGSLIVSELASDPQTSRKAIVVVGEFAEEPTWPGNVSTDAIYLVRGDCTRLEVLEKAGIRRATHAIILADRLVPRSDQDRDARAVLTAMLIERAHKEVFTSVELLNRDNATFLKSIGVDEIVVGDEYAASVIAAGTKHSGIVRVLDELLSSSYGNQFYKLELPATLAGKPFAELATLLKEQHDALLIGTEQRLPGGDKGNRKIDVNPPRGHAIAAGDQLLVIARKLPKL